MEEGRDSLEGLDGAEASVLPDGQLQEEDGQSDQGQHDDVGPEKSSWNTRRLVIHPLTSCLRLYLRSTDIIQPLTMVSGGKIRGKNKTLNFLTNKQ